MRPGAKAIQLGKPASSLSSEEIDQLKSLFGVEHLNVDKWGNIIDQVTGQIIAHGEDPSVYKENNKAKAKEYFRDLPSPVKEALLAKVLAVSVDEAEMLLSEYNGSGHRKWELSYKEMADLIAEGILVGDGE